MVEINELNELKKNVLVEESNRKLSVSSKNNRKKSIFEDSYAYV